MYTFRRCAVAICVAAVSLVLAACSSVEKPKPVELGNNPALIGVRTAWQASVGSVDFPLVLKGIGNHVLIANSEGSVVSIDVRTGADNWRTALSVPLTAGVGGDGRYAAVVSQSNELIVLDNGQEIWRQKLGALTVTPPLVAGGRVFVLSADRTMSAFDAQAGRRLWQQQRSGDPLILGEAGILTAVGDTLVAGQGGRLTGINPQNGSVRWEASIANSRGTNEVERLADLVAGVSRDGDVVCARSFQSAVGCVDAARGRLLWSKPSVGTTGLTGDSGTIFSSESNGRLVAWKRDDGEKKWSSDKLLNRQLSAPLLVGTFLVVGENNGTLHFINKDDGSILNRVETDGYALASAPVLMGTTLVAITKRGLVTALRPE